MRLTILSHFLGRGGSTGFVLQMRDFFQSRGHEVTLVAGRKTPDAATDDYTTVPSPPHQTWRQRMCEYVRVVEETQPDVVYTLCGQDEFEVLRFLRFPRAVHCMGIERHELADLPLWHRQLEPFTEMRTTHTPDLLEKVKGDPRHHIHLAYVPHRIPTVFLEAPDVSEAPAKLDRPVEVCFLGRLENFQKRVDWLPEIMQRCQRACANLVWHIYGAGPAENQLRGNVAKSGLTENVIFHGWQNSEAITAALAHHDLFFLCSRWEGLPGAMVEAMLCGMACLVPNFPAGMTYMVATGGGWAYEALSPRHSAESLIKAVSDRAVLQRKRREAQAIARAMYNETVVDRHLVHAENVLKSLTFNGNVCLPQTARRMKIVTLPVLLRRKIFRLLRYQNQPA